MQILVVEDEPVLRELANVILQECGYSVLQASTGVEALKLWEANKESIDLVITDMVMPEGMSGMDLAYQLHSVRPDVRIVFASGYSMDDLNTSFLRRGRTAFLQKPYTHTTLAQTVRSTLDQS